ncbi:MAG: hypothetical protein Q8R02_24015 [Hyphomonadaceae bacterium]|nr:hypothetical protein [Hyphomonadaceae bacterium]
MAIGEFSSGSNSYLIPSQIWIDGDKVLFGGYALKHAQQASGNGRRAATSFKTLLGGKSLTHILDQKPPRSVDETGQFSNGSLICLFLAHVFAAMKRAAIAAPHPFSLENAELRYTQPVWIQSDPSLPQAMIAHIYNQAAWLAQVLAESLLAPSGLPCRMAVDAFKLYHTAEMPALVAGHIHEAIAAANCFVGPDVKNVLAIDMGAGTTDIAGFSFFRQDGQERAVELTAARRMLNVAGDALDTIVMNCFLARAGPQSTGAQQDLWDALTPTVRSLKEKAFGKGSAMFDFNGELLTVSRAQIESTKEFKSLTDYLSREFGNALAAMEKACADRGGGELTLVAAGGGSRTPFLRRMIADAKPRNRRVRFSRVDGDPAWAKDITGAYASALPQLLTAIGGAAAPDFQVVRQREAHRPAVTPRQALKAGAL